jgi:hypothetical protein
MARAIDPKAKAKRQKIVAVVGGVILLGLLAWRVPPMIALMNKKPPTSSTSPAAAAPAPVAPTPGAPVTPTPGTTGGSGSAELADSDISPAAGPGQLVSFGRFVSKDPFVQQAGKRCVDSAGVTIVCPTGSASSSKPTKPSKKPELELETPANEQSTPKPSARAGAQISVNGATDGVAIGATFPTVDPVFRLVSVSGKTVKVAIDGGTYASGEATITLTKGQPVTLVNTADGTRYRVVLVSTG